MTASFEDIDFTLDSFKDLLKSIFHETPVSVELKQLGKNQGFLSVLVKVDVSWPSASSPSLPKTIVFKKPTKKKLEKLFGTVTPDKAPTNGETPPFVNIDTYLKFLFVGHNAECGALELMGRDLVDPPVPVPKLYACQRNTENQLNGYIAMEDVSASTTLPDFGGQGMTVAQLEQVALHLARLHAFCVKDTSWQAKFPDKIPFPDDPDSMRLQIATMRKNFPDLFCFTDEELALVTDEHVLEPFFNFDLSRDLYPVLAHGDLWSYNLLVDNRDNTTIRSIIDWQLAEIGSPVKDLAMLLAISAAPEIRRSKSEFLLDTYHSEFTKALHPLPAPATRAQLGALFQDATSILAFINLIQLPVMMEGMELGDEDKMGLVLRLVASVEDSLAQLASKKS